MRCPGCGADAARVFYAQDGAPTNSCLLLGDRDEARSFPRGSIRLALCGSCGLVANVAFDESLVRYTDAYEDSQFHSARFRAFAEELAEDLAARYALRGERVLEIGAGGGEFLELLCSSAGCTGVGVDPATRGRAPSPAAPVRLVAEPFSARHCSPPPALVLCRHTLEHIPRPATLLEELARGLERGRGTPVVFEVPDAIRILRDGAFWDVYYEHVNYFTPTTLARLFERSGFSVGEVALAFEDQYILLHARRDADLLYEPSGAPDEVGWLQGAAAQFASDTHAARLRWSETIATTSATGRQIVLWGSGSKATGFLTALGVGEIVAAVVDVNPRKQGRFVAGTGHPIVAPAALVDIRPGLVVVMNPAYRDEISADLSRLGVVAEVQAL